MASEQRIVLCPYCGHTQRCGDRCEECGGFFEALSREATLIEMGPWYIRDKRKPFQPGCSYETIKRHVENGRIRRTTVIRGPTTRQFWSVAKHVPGVAHLLGYCHSCLAKVSPEAEKCPQCGAAFVEPTYRDSLGLPFDTTAEANAARRRLERKIEQLQAHWGEQAAPHATPAGEGARTEPAHGESENTAAHVSPEEFEQPDPGASPSDASLEAVSGEEEMEEAARDVVTFEDEATPSPDTPRRSERVAGQALDFTPSPASGLANLAEWTGTEAPASTDGASDPASRAPGDTNRVAFYATLITCNLVVFVLVLVLLFWLVL
jgi:hypothetical protein